MSAPLTLHLLGGAAIAHGDDPLADFRSRTAEALLLYLACHDRPISRQFLADFFWDDRTQKQASANLRAVLSMLRKQVGDYLTADRQTIAFNHKEPNWVDALVFETQIRVLEPRLNQPGGLTAENCHQLEAAMALYQGDFLAGFHLSESRGFEEWVVVQRERLRRLAVLGLRRLVEYFLENGRYQTGIAYAERLIAADPYNEEAQRRQMWLLIRSGRRNSALDSYQRFKALLEEDLAVDPSQATTAVYDKIAALTFPPPDNIAVPPAPLIGRKAEVNELFGELIRPDGRLITITGPGGVGKTSLALEIANQFKRVRPGYFLDGLWFVPLAPVHSGRFLESAAANALALTFRGTAAPRSQLLNHLQNREMLLIFDNFEHLLVGEDSAVTLISDILEQAPGVKILATSREQLNLREELIFDIEGLPYPTGPTPPEAAADFGAVAVFLQNARRVSRRFEPEAADFKTISRICRLLEGMPLGLEMAAAWVRHDNVGQILARLEESLQALASTWRNIPERHRSLQSVFDHSWQLLTAQEQAEFVRLAVFQGGFSPGAALAVAGMSKPSVYHGKSLLRREEYGRFAMHNLIHQFTADKLRRDEAAHAAALRSHAHHYLHLLQEQENAFYGDPAQSALNKITTDLENIRQAWQWAVDQGELALLDKAYLSLYLYYETRGWFEEGQTHFQEAVTRLGERLGEIEQADREGQLVFGRLQSRAGWFAYRCGQIDQAFKRCQDSAAGFRRLNAEADLAQSLNDLGILARRSGDYEKGKEMLTESLAIRRQIGDERGVAACLNNLANVVRMLGEYDQAREHLLQSIALLQEQGNLIMLANAFNDLGEISRATGSYEEARKYYEESLAIRQKINNPNDIAICLNNLGSIAHTQGDYEGARGYAEVSLRLFLESGNKRAAPYPLSVLGRIARDEADFIASFAAFRRALQICYEINYVPKSIDILFELATVLEAMKRPEAAVRLLAFVITHPKINHETRKAAEALHSELAENLAVETAVELVRQGQQDTLEHVLRTVLSRELERPE